MGIVDTFLQFPVFVIKFEAAIRKANSDQIADSFDEGDPIMITCVRVQIHEFGILVGVGIPFVNHIVFPETILVTAYLVT